MARHETDREDLLREATALVERIELSITAFDEPIVCGFRRDGGASFYFGADPVYQFNAAKELRRAFVDGRLLKAECGRLIALLRQRSHQEVALIRHDLTSNESAAILAQLSTRLVHLEEELQTGQAAINGQVPPDTDVIGRVRVWLNSRPTVIPVANAPNAS